MSPVRRCSKPSCGRMAYATLTYVYADSTAVVGPLATFAEPHCYDLCQSHAESLTAPRGWEVVRLAADPEALLPSIDDLEALADAVREAARGKEPLPAPEPEPMVEVGRRGHLQLLRPAEDATPEADAVLDVRPLAPGVPQDLGIAELEAEIKQEVREHMARAEARASEDARAEARASEDARAEARASEDARAEAGTQEREPEHQRRDRDFIDEIPDYYAEYLPEFEE